MGDFAAVFAEVGVRLDRGAGGYFPCEPGGEGGLFCDLAGEAEAGDDGGGVVAVGVGEVSEIEGGFHGRVGRCQVELSFRSGPRDVGRHAEGVDGRVVP